MPNCVPPSSFHLPNKHPYIQEHAACPRFCSPYMCSPWTTDTLVPFTVSYRIIIHLAVLFATLFAYHERVEFLSAVVEEVHLLVTTRLMPWWPVEVPLSWHWFHGAISSAFHAEHMRLPIFQAWFRCRDMANACVVSVALAHHIRPAVL